MNKILNIFIVIVSFIFITPNVFAKDYKIIQFSDLHFNNSTDSIENYKKLIKEINSIEDVDFVVTTGDNIASANPEYLKTFLLLSKKIKRPFYIQIGNHDVFKQSKLSKEVYLEYIRRYTSHKFLRQFNYIVEKGDFIFIFLDGTKEYIPTLNGYYKDDTLEFLDKNLKKYKNKNVIIFQHYPLIKKSLNSNHNLYKAEDYEKVLQKHKNILAIISGHYHTNKYENLDGIQNFVSASASEKNQKSYQVIFIEDLGHKNYELIFSTQKIGENKD